jgi:hypothetical protein
MHRGKYLAGRSSGRPASGGVSLVAEVAGEQNGQS